MREGRERGGGTHGTDRQTYTPPLRGWKREPRDKRQGREGKGRIMRQERKGVYEFCQGMYED